MSKKRTPQFSWNCVAGFKLDDRLDHHIRHEANRICQLCCGKRQGKHQFLVNMQQSGEDSFNAILTCRNGGFIFCTSDTANNAIDAFEAAAAKLEEQLKRPYRFSKKGKTLCHPRLIEPTERFDSRAPQNAQDVLGEMLKDYLLRLQRFVRRRLRSEALVHPDWPVANISDGEIVDETALRVATRHPSVIPWGAFWPWVIEICEQVLQEFLSESRKASQSSISLDADLPEEEEDWDPGYDVEHPYYIIERMLNPVEEELVDATPDEKSAAPSSIAEYQDFVTYLNSVMADWPEPHKKIVELHAFENLQPHEIAFLIKKEESEILSILNETMPKVRQIMADVSEK